MTPQPRRLTCQSRTGDYRWRSRDGVVNMHDMTIFHLENAIAVAATYRNTGKLRQLKEVLETKKCSMP